MKGRLIALEGLDGSGKHTQSILLSERLTKQGYKNRFISFPNYKSSSSSLVQMYLNGRMCAKTEEVNAYAAASFFAVDRYASYISDWNKSFLSGEIIISDRYTTSNAIYQTTKVDIHERDSFINWIYDYEYCKLGLPKPSIVIYLKVPLNLSQKLLENRYKGTKDKKDMYESDMEFLKKCELMSDYVSKRDNWHVIDCGLSGTIKSKEEIHEEIFRLIKREGIIDA